MTNEWDASPTNSRRQRWCRQCQHIPFLLKRMKEVRYDKSETD